MSDKLTKMEDERTQFMEQLRSIRQPYLQEGAQTMPEEKWQEQEEIIARVETLDKEIDAEKQQARALQERKAVDDRFAALEQREQEIEYPATLPQPRSKQKQQDIMDGRDANGFRWEQTQGAKQTITSARSLNHRNRMLERQRLRMQDRSGVDNELLLRAYMEYGLNPKTHFMDRSPKDRDALLRAFQMDIDTTGGYLRPPDAIAMDVIQEIDDEVYIMAASRVHQLDLGQRLRIMARNERQDDAEWTSELQDAPQDDSVEYGEVMLDPHRLTKFLLVSRDMWTMNSSIFMEEFSSEMMYAFDITIEKVLLNGTGAGQPQGLLVDGPDNAPIQSNRNFSDGNTATAITYDGVTRTKFQLKKQYRRRAKWMFHRDACARLYLIKDVDGRPIYHNALREGETDMFAGLPVMESEYMPNTFTTGQTVGLLGDFMRYRIAVSKTFETQVLDQPWARGNQVGFVARWYLDAKPDLGEAFVRMQLA